jgi:hypothetical protein
MKRAVTNWTSTEVPMWDTDCVQYWRAGLPFELRNVVLPEHHAFVEQFAAAHGLRVSRENTTVVFTFEEPI